MSDITTIWSTALSSADWAVSGAMLASGQDLESALIISVFSDRVAGPDDVIPDGTDNPRGWCLDDSGRPIGSRMWLLQRAKQVPETARRARDYIIEAIQWLIDDKVVARFDVSVQWIAAGKLGAQITAYMQDGGTTSKISKRFLWAWNGVT